MVKNVNILALPITVPYMAVCSVRKHAGVTYSTQYPELRFLAARSHDDKVWMKLQT